MNSPHALIQAGALLSLLDLPHVAPAACRAGFLCSLLLLLWTRGAWPSASSLLRASLFHWWHKETPCFLSPDQRLFCVVSHMHSTQKQRYSSKRSLCFGSLSSNFSGRRKISEHRESEPGSGTVWEGRHKAFGVKTRLTLGWGWEQWQRKEDKVTST